MDRAGGALSATLVLHRAAPPGHPRSAGRRLVEEHDRCLPPCQVASGGAATISGSGPRDTRPPAVLRPLRTAPDAPGRGRVRERPESGGLGAARGPVAGLAALGRTPRDVV